MHVCVYLYICGVGMCANSTPPFYLAVCGLLASQKEEQVLLPLYLPWQMPRWRPGWGDYCCLALAGPAGALKDAAPAAKPNQAWKEAAASFSRVPPGRLAGRNRQREHLLLQRNTSAGDQCWIEEPGLLLSSALAATQP